MGNSRESNYIAWHLPSARWARNLQTVTWIRRTHTLICEPLATVRILVINDVVRMVTLPLELSPDPQPGSIPSGSTYRKASLPETALESQQMIRDADAALYRAKRDGGDRAYLCPKL